jgi:small subunit ribosomal protein S4e
MHIKRKTISKFWPIKRTGTKYMAVPSHEKNSSLPLIIAMRDILRRVRTKKELKGLMNQKKIKINGRVISEINYPICLFDIISFPDTREFYRLSLKDKKFLFQDIKEGESKSRIYKVLGKKKVSGKEFQFNLSNGRNILSDKKIDTGDFLILSFDNKILDHIKLSKGVQVLVIGGKYAGTSGKITETYREGENEMVSIESDKSEKLKINSENIFVKEK